MGTLAGKWDEEECSVIGEKGEIGFIDYEDNESVYSYNPAEEGPVIISAPFSFEGGKPQSVFVEETTADSITIKNTTRDSVELWGIRIYASNPENTFTLSLMEPPSKNSNDEYKRTFVESFAMEDRVLQPGQLLTIWLSCKPKEIGLHTSVVHFDVGDERIERVAFVLVEDKISQSLTSKKPYSRGTRKMHFHVDAPVRGVPPIRTTNREKKPRLPWYDIPRDVRELVESKQIPNVVREGLTRTNYDSYFRNLLIMEEIHMEEDMRAYDMECVSMRKRGTHFLTLQVPGLAERRPSLVHGDHIYVQLVADDANDTSFSYQGYIHRVEADEVYLRFAPEFHSYHRDSDIFNVQFTYNRVNIRRLCHAVDAATKLESEFLFPSESSQMRRIATTPLVPISCILNEEQIFSIEMILGCKGAPPYVIYGPPGTGKTMTLVEAILQLYTTRENTRILVCAASNSAADYILEKLLSEKAVSVQENELFRLNATSRPYEDIKPDYIRFCFFEEFIFKCPPLEALMRYRIIISTYMSVSSLFAEGVQTGHFSHIFLDEAGQASEPETMVPLSNFCERETVVVLAGDPMQLGPVIYSRDAESCGLGKSYLQRLFEYEFYYSENENYVTKLVRNYRCHPEILHLPSKLFYQGELIACKDDICPSMPWVNILPNKEFPVLFIGVQGCDEREGSNPSWFNRIEASKVVEIIKKLTASNEVSDEDIGVITPYRQQALKIKTALDSSDMADIKVGSVEQFQGQERQIIIISSVRSTIKHNEFDRTFCLGFLSNPRRFNVAITRARSLLIIIGNPHIVCKDPYWNKLLWRCSDNGSYQGCALPDRQDYPDEDPAEQNGLNYKDEENDQPLKESVWAQNPFQHESCQAEWNCKTDRDEVTRGQESSQSECNEKPVTDGAEWSKGGKESEWSQKSFQAENNATHKVEWNQESCQELSCKAVRDEVKWGQESSQSEWNEKPVTNEAEWNDWNV